MQLPQTLTLAEVKTKAREYYEAGKLTAQHPNPDMRACVNKGTDGHRCAVAAAFNDDVLDAHPRGTIYGVRLKGGVVIPNEDYEGIATIQDAHDNWALASKHGEFDVADRKQRFLKLIDAA